MDDLEDELQLSREQTDLLRRICEAVVACEESLIRRKNYDQMLILFTVLQSLGISNDYLDFVVDELRSLDNPEELLKPLSTLPSQPTTNGFFSHTEVARFGHSTCGSCRTIFSTSTRDS